jgi:hypothetical protein
MSKRKPLTEWIEQGAGTSGLEAFTRIVRKECNLKPRAVIDDDHIMNTLSTLFQHPMGRDWDRDAFERAIARGDLAVVRADKLRMTLLLDVWKSVRRRVRDQTVLWAGDRFAQFLNECLERYEVGKRDAAQAEEEQRRALEERKRAFIGTVEERSAGLGCVWIGLPKPAL